jgi:hypothetical protein
VEHHGEAQEHCPEVQGGVSHPPRKAAPRRKLADDDAERAERHAAQGEEGRPSLIKGLKSVHTLGLSHTVDKSCSPVPCLSTTPQAPSHGPLCGPQNAGGLLEGVEVLLHTVSIPLEWGSLLVLGPSSL